MSVPAGEGRSGQAAGAGTPKGSLCALCGQARPAPELTPLSLLRPALARLIVSERPDLPPDALICEQDVNLYRRRYLERLIATDKGEISALERQVIEALAREQTLAANIDAAADRAATAGQRVADRMASFGGSWTFITSFAIVLVAWMALNTLLLAGEAFDPFPYILLNLILSCLAAIQAPIIMMSQNRQEARDRRRAENDYQVNLKAELEIRHLHEKLDFLLQRQWGRLIEIQELQLEMLEEIARTHSSGS